MKQPLVAPKSAIEDPELQKLVQFYEETLGFCPNSVKTMHIRPRIALAFVEMNKAVMENHGRVTSALKRLVGYLTSFRTGCMYCQAHTIRAAERYQASSEQLDNIWSYSTHPAFSEAERAALDFALAASAVPNEVTDQFADNLRKHWDEGEIVELLAVIALFGYLNRWNDSMGTELEAPALDSAQTRLTSKTNWTAEKHAYKQESGN
ncbi:MAG: carboxymuconolactone decarboxylase family protein [Cytophagales bacterium]|nr:MAG: carboxymuconolactone decarboxylase family protein [Cytophagales bacterium]TAF59507.1 MAG: carboxymuconolactone decarboxylase family protein [Cytophagales bacterium]